jgi:hypothetical protein
LELVKKADSTVARRPRPAQKFVTPQQQLLDKNITL